MERGTYAANREQNNSFCYAIEPKRFRVLKWLSQLAGEWRLEGWDAFAGHGYRIGGRFRSRAHAERAARRHLAAIERMQPSDISGGQSGIQDQVFIIAPDGRRIRVIGSEHHVRADCR